MGQHQSESTHVPAAWHTLCVPHGTCWHLSGCPHWHGEATSPASHVAPAGSWDSWMEGPASQRAASCCTVRPSVPNAGTGAPISPFHR